MEEKVQVLLCWFIKGYPPPFPFAKVLQNNPKSKHWPEKKLPLEKDIRSMLLEVTEMENV